MRGGWGVRVSLGAVAVSEEREDREGLLGDSPVVSGGVSGPAAVESDAASDGARLGAHVSVGKVGGAYAARGGVRHERPPGVGNG